MRKRVGTLCIMTTLSLCAAGCGTREHPSADTAIRFSWWGGESRHQATVQAVQAFETAHPDIRVATEYGAWNGWEDAVAAALYAGTEPDVMQVNQNWLSDYQSAESGFLDLNAYSNIIDLTQYDADILEMCTVDGELRCIPISETGRVFFWNETVFASAGIPVPDSYAALCKAGRIFQEKLGDDYYPLALGWYDRMLFAVYLLQCKYGREWTLNGALQYSEAELAEALGMIDLLEKTHVIPPLKQIDGGGADSFDKDENFITGKYAGIYEWDSSAGKFIDSLDSSQTLTIGTYFTDLGAYHGGFSKIAQGFAISKHTEHPEACAELIAYLVSDAEAVRLLGIERGVPLNHQAYEICDTAGLLGNISAEASQRMNDWLGFQIAPEFENAALKGSGGVYEDVFTGLSYGDYSISQAAERLYAGIQTALAGGQP